MSKVYCFFIAVLWLGIYTFPCLGGETAELITNARKQASAEKQIKEPKMSAPKNFRIIAVNTENSTSKIPVNSLSVSIEVEKK